MANELLKSSWNIFLTTDVMFVSYAPRSRNLSLFVYQWSTKCERKTKSVNYSHKIDIFLHGVSVTSYLRIQNKVVTYFYVLYYFNTFFKIYKPARYSEIC